MIITKDNLTIRSAVAADAQLLTDWWNDGTVMAHAGFPNGLGQSVEQTREQIKRNETKLSQLCIIEIGGTRAGEMSFGIGNGFAEIGIKICDATCQNNGYGSRLIRMLVDFLFADEKINKAVPIGSIRLDTNLKNIRAQHVYEKLGFQRKATNIDIWTDQLGQKQSSVDYEMTRDVWLTLEEQ